MKASIRHALIAVVAIAGCREGDGTLSPGSGRVYVDSDPPGANILVDNRDTGRNTPDTLRGVGGRHDISVQLDTFRALYGFTARVFVPETDSVPTIAGPIVNRCADALCYGNQFRQYAANRVRFSNNPVGTFFLERGAGNGIIWPSTSSNSYAAGSMIGFAGIVNGRDTVSLGIYDNGYLAGRPAPSLTQVAGEIDLEQRTWIVPPPNTASRMTARGIQIDEHIHASESAEDIVLIHLVFRNISNNRLYRLLDPLSPETGLTYDQVFIGFLLDPDVGTPNDDALSYEPALDLVFAYDSRFDETDFGQGYNRKPGMIGLRMTEAPAGARIVLNGWTPQTSSPDWFAGQASEGTGWRMLSGVRPYEPDHPDIHIGHLPQAPGDVRMSVSAGPLRLAPGDSAAVTIAVMLAEPIDGTFTSGTAVEPGEPTDRTRKLFAVSAGLLERAATASAAAALLRTRLHASGQTRR